MMVGQVLKAPRIKAANTRHAAPAVRILVDKYCNRAHPHPQAAEDASTRKVFAAMCDIYDIM